MRLLFYFFGKVKLQVMILSFFVLSLENLLALVRALTHGLRWTSGALDRLLEETGRGPLADQPDIVSLFK